MEIKNSILIIDDEKSNLLYLNHILSADYKIYTARNSYEGIQRANQYDPDLILLDIIMPGMDGYEMLAELKNSDKTKNIPVIFITGLSSKDDEEKGLNLGAEDYIAKPFSDAIVKLRVRNQIKIKNQNRLIISKEIAERSSRNKAEFLSRMSHEMRTPMNAILGMTAIAQNTNDPEKIKNSLKKTENASKELLKLINNVLEISDIEEGKIKLEFSEFSLGKFLQNVFNKYCESFKDKNIYFTSTIDPLIPELIMCDEKRLAQIIENLLSNAQKFTPENGMVKINVFLKNKKDDLLTIQVDVSDNGIGISEKCHENIFDAFEQFDGGINRKYNGAGLGLSISKGLVRMMNGDIWVEPRLNEGSTFSFTFDAKIPEEKTGEGYSGKFCNKTALLAEDVEINREIVIAMLEDTQLKIVCASNGLEAVNIYEKDPEKFDVIFMDINMPEMDGLEASRRIRKFEEELRLSERLQGVPIIAMTANVLPEEIEKCLDAGMTDHIGKPVDFEILVNKINHYLC